MHRTQRLANVVRTAVKEHYGIREEKVAELGGQPFRGRKPKAAPEKPAPPAPPPAASGGGVKTEQQAVPSGGAHAAPPLFLPARWRT